MELTNEIRERIRTAIVADRENYPSDNRHSVALGISASVYNAIKKGNYDRQVSEANWICIARRLGVVLKKEMAWVAAETPTFLFPSHISRPSRKFHPSPYQSSFTANVLNLSLKE